MKHIRKQLVTAIGILFLGFTAFHFFKTPDLPYSPGCVPYSGNIQGIQFVKATQHAGTNLVQLEYLNGGRRVQEPVVVKNAGILQLNDQENAWLLIQPEYDVFLSIPPAHSLQFEIPTLESTLIWRATFNVFGATGKRTSNNRLNVRESFWGKVFQEDIQHQKTSGPVYGDCATPLFKGDQPLDPSLAAKYHLIRVE